jgi:hypothetical protein
MESNPIPTTWENEIIITQVFLQEKFEERDDVTRRRKSNKEPIQ